MSNISELIKGNREWAEDIKKTNPEFFKTLSKGQAPEYLWIGCSDSRVPANQVCGLVPGEVFVHRNVANVVVPSDLNALSTLQFAVERLKVSHVMVVGHYGCSGVQAALEGARIGLADNWLRHIQDVRDRHANILDQIDPQVRANALCELNVIEQVRNVCQSTVLQDAWMREQEVTVHGWVYGLHDGLLQDLHLTADSNASLDAMHAKAVAKVGHSTPRP